MLEILSCNLLLRNSNIITSLVIEYYTRGICKAYLITISRSTLLALLKTQVRIMIIL